LAFTSRLFFFSRIIFFLFKYRGALLASCTGSLPTTNHLWWAGGSRGGHQPFLVEAKQPGLCSGGVRRRRSGGFQQPPTTYGVCRRRSSGLVFAIANHLWCSPKAMANTKGGWRYQRWWRSRPPEVVGGCARRYSSDQRCR
jgi:hypothetical protein